MSEDQDVYNGLSHQVGTEFFTTRQGFNMMEDMQRWRAENPHGTVKQFVDHLVQKKYAIRHDKHPGFVYRHFGW
jgi:hypothetical protein